MLPVWETVMNIEDEYGIYFRAEMTRLLAVKTSIKRNIKDDISVFSLISFIVYNAIP